MYFNVIFMSQLLSASPRARRTATLLGIMIVASCLQAVEAVVSDPTAAAAVRIDEGLKGCMQARRSHSGSSVRTASCRDTELQKWSLTSCMQLSLAGTSLCLQDTGEGLDAEILPCDCDNEHQILQIRPALVNAGAYMIRSSASRRCLDGNFRKSVTMKLRFVACEFTAHYQHFRSHGFEQLPKAGNLFNRPTFKSLTQLKGYDTHLHEDDFEVMPSLETGGNPTENLAPVVLYTSQYWEGLRQHVSCCRPHEMPDPSSPDFMAISSIQVPQGTAAVLYSRPSCTGNPLATLYGSVPAMSWLPHNIGCILVQRARSRQIESSDAHETDNSKPSSRDALSYGVTLFGSAEYMQPVVTLPGLPAPAMYAFNEETVLEFENGLSVESVRVPAGYRLALFTSRDFSGSQLVASHDTPLIENFVAHSAVVTKTPWSQLSGVVLCSGAAFGGYCQHMPPGSHPELGILAGTASSLFMPTKGFRVVLYDQEDFKGKTWRTWRNMTDFDMLQGLTDRAHSLEVIVECDPDCGQNGECVAPNSCRCYPGYRGSSCQHRAPDATSVITCERNYVYVGDTIQCAIRPRYQGLDTAAFLEDFRAITLGFVRLTEQPTGVRSFRSTGSANDRLLERIEFNVTGNKATDDFWQLFDAQVVTLARNGELLSWEHLQVPYLKVLNRPDNTSQITCHLFSNATATKCVVTLAKENTPAAVFLTDVQVDVTTDFACHPVVDRSQPAGDPTYASVFEFRIYTPARSCRSARSSLASSLSASHGQHVMHSFEAVVRIALKCSSGQVLCQATAPMRPFSEADAISQARHLLGKGQLWQTKVLLQDALANNNPDGDSASAAVKLRLLMADVDTLLGRFLEANDQLTEVLASTSSQPVRDLAKQKTLDVLAAQRSCDEADLAMFRGGCDRALSKLDLCIKASPASVRPLLARANCRKAAGNGLFALRDVNAALRLDQDNVRGLVLLSRIYHEDLDRTSEAQAVLKRCIRVTSDGSKEQQACLDRLEILEEIRNLTFHSSRFIDLEKHDQAVAALMRLMELDPDSMAAARAQYQLCLTQFQRNTSSDTVEACTAALDHPRAETVLGTNETTNAHLCRAFAHLILQNFDAAWADVAKASAMDPSNPRVLRLRARIQRESRRLSSQRVDYYKVLNVSRDATQQQIRSAYRRLARVYHPDKNTAEDAADTFQKIVEAYEILSDPDLRRRFDRGMDVTLDSSQRNRQKRESTAEWMFTQFANEFKRRSKEQQGGAANNNDGPRDHNGPSGSDSQGDSGRTSSQGSREHAERIVVHLPKHCCLEHKTW